MSPNYLGPNDLNHVDDHWPSRFFMMRQMVDLRYQKTGGSLVPKDSIARKYFHFSISLKKKPHKSSSPGARVHIPPDLYQEQGSDPENFRRRCSLSWEMGLLNTTKSVSSYTGHDWQMALCSTFNQPELLKCRAGIRFLNRNMYYIVLLQNVCVRVFNHIFTLMRNQGSILSVLLICFPSFIFRQVTYWFR